MDRRVKPGGDTAFVETVGKFESSLCPHSVNIENRNNLFFSFRPCIEDMPRSVEGVVYSDA